MTGIPRPCLMLITDRTLLTPNWTLGQALAPAVTGGVNLVVLRETDLPKGPRLTVARFVLDGIRGRVPMLTSGDPGFAMEAGADGVMVEHPEQAADAREVIGPERILGVVLSSPNAAGEAESARADFGLLNLDWANTEGALDIARRFLSITRLPLITGVDVPIDLVQACVNIGSAGVAVCAPGMSAYNRTEAAQLYARSLGIVGSP